MFEIIDQSPQDAVIKVIGVAVAAATLWNT
jgi:hypothetical protein